MTILTPTSLAMALDQIKANPGALLLAGGTDVMVEVNERRRTLSVDGQQAVIALAQVPELTSWTVDLANRRLTLGAGVTWAEIEHDPIRSWVPALAEAARTVGSPQIRNAGTVGGNLGTCSPAGDGLPVLAALEAVVEMVSINGRRSLPVADFMVGVKRTGLLPGEIIGAIHLPILDGWQGYSKVGVRNAMVIATASACLAVDQPARSIRLALGSVAPTVVRCPAAEMFAVESVDWSEMSVADDVVRRFGALAAGSSRPITDHRSTAEYRRHAVTVMASRLLQRAFPDS